MLILTTKENGTKLTFLKSFDMYILFVTINNIILYQIIDTYDIYIFIK